MNPSQREQACRICTSTTKSAAYEAKEMMFGTRERFSYLQCSHCGCLQIADIPQDLPRYYPRSYYSPIATSPKRDGALRTMLRHVRDRSTAMGIGGFLGKALARVYPNTLLELVRRAGLNPSSRVLDVGCGGAGLLRSLADLGVTDVLGIDPFVDADIVYANGATIRRQQLDQVTGKWDIIMFNHSLEHMPGQVQVMRTAAELLAPAGTCLVRIPTVSSLAWQTYHQHWVQIDAPRHLYLHSRRSIAILAGKAGLEVSLIVDDSTAFQFWGSEQVKRNIATYEESSLLRQNGTSTFSRKALRYYERRAARLNADGIGDQAAFFLRRIDQYA